MLNFTLKGTYPDGSGYEWDFYGDDETPNDFYIIPQPTMVLGANSAPELGLTQYTTNDPNTNGQGFCTLEVELSVPAAVEAAILKMIPTIFPSTAPRIATLQYNRGGTAYLTVNAGATSITYEAPVSAFGGNVATFSMPLDKDQLSTLSAAMATNASGLTVYYDLSVPARLPAVTAVLGFDSSVAYQYQVTQATHNMWGHETSPRSVEALLKQSNSSSVTISWGTSTPAASLQAAVATWANSTLANLVSAQVKQVIALQGQTSDDSFNITEVSSFKSTYSQNMVVDWLISPTATLPSIQQLGLKPASFLATVNEQQQAMTVAVHLPFQGDTQADQGVPVVDAMPLFVESVTVTAKYKTLGQADGTKTLKANGSVTFTAPYDTTAGPDWELDYTVTYVGQSLPVSGTVKSIDTAGYTLALEEAGLLSVAFNASMAFADQSSTTQSVLVDLTYVDNQGRAIGIRESLTLTPTTQTGSITSLQPFPIDTPYNYTVTYNLQGGETFKAPTINNQTGFSAQIPACEAQHQTTIILYTPTSTDSPIFEADLQIFYAAPPTVAGAVTQPSKASPAKFTLTPGTTSSMTKATFYGFTNGNQPIVYSASISGAAGQIDIDGQPVMNLQPTILLTATQRYFTITVDPGALDWAGVDKSLGSVTVDLSVSVSAAGTSPAPQPVQSLISWNNGEADLQYVTTSYQVGQTVTYIYTATYVQHGQPIKTATGGTVAKPLTAILLDVPPSSTAK